MQVRQNNKNSCGNFNCVNEVLNSPCKGVLEHENNSELYDCEVQARKAAVALLD